MSIRGIVALTALASLMACSALVPPPPVPSAGHLRVDDNRQTQDIPPVVDKIPLLPRPEPAPDLEKYTVVVNEVPVKELLFALARDAQVNVDIDPGIEGIVTLNAIDQTLPQILDRIARQADVRFRNPGQERHREPGSAVPPHLSSGLRQSHPRKQGHHRRRHSDRNHRDE